jgi:catecholate siderophore receptor
MKYAKVPSKARSRHIRLVTLATVTACAAAGGRTLAIAQPSPANGPTNSNPPESTLPVRRFNIPAGPLDAALHEFESQSGLHADLNLQADRASSTGMSPTEVLNGFNSPGVTGLYSNSVALRQLLKGTGLSFRFQGPNRVQIGLQHTDSVDVSTALPDSVSMQKFPEPLLDTPQSISVVPQFLIQDEGVSTLKDALRNVPGISLAAGESGAQGDNLTIRGFTARNDIFLDGIRDFGSYYRDAFNYEQVDVLEGPSGIQFGRGSTGGVINQESKVPQAMPFINVQSQLGTDLTRRIAADINQPLPGIASGSAIRLNIMGVEAGVAERDDAEIRRVGIAPSISIGLNAKTHATLSYVHLNENDTPDYGLPWFFNKLAPGVNRSSYFGFPDKNFLRTSDDIVTLRADHDFTSALNLHTIARAANYPRNVQITEPQICSNAAVSVPVGGTVTALPTSSVTGLPCTYSSSNPSAIAVNRNQIQVKSVEGDLWDQTELSAHFKTLGLPHILVAGAEGGQEISNPIKYSYTINGLNSVPSTTLLDPDEQQPFAGTKYIASITHTKSDSVGLYFIDIIHLGRLFEISGGIRWDRFDTGFNLYQPTPPAGGTVTAAIPPISRIDEQPTPPPRVSPSASAPRSCRPKKMRPTRSAASGASSTSASCLKAPSSAPKKTTPARPTPPTPTTLCSPAINSSKAHSSASSDAFPRG